jgi:hypothetical protein
VPGSINRRIVAQASVGKKRDPISKISGAKRARGIAQAVLHLHQSIKSLVQTPAGTKKEKERKNTSGCP